MSQIDVQDQYFQVDRFVDAIDPFSNKLVTIFYGHQRVKCIYPGDHTNMIVSGMQSFQHIGFPSAVPLHITLLGPRGLRGES